MIALADNLPLIRLPDRRAIRFERPWMTHAVSEAAKQAGYSHWWLAPHVTESVASYLEGEYGENFIPSQCLHTLVTSVLQVIGYPEVARTFRILAPPVRISLVPLAESAGSGFELAFFRQLDETLRAALHGDAPRLELCGLTECVKHLRASRVWRKDCTALRNEIVAHVRGHAARLHLQSLHLELT